MDWPLMTLGVSFLSGSSSLSFSPSSSQVAGPSLIFFFLGSCITSSMRICRWTHASVYLFGENWARSFGPFRFSRRMESKASGLSRDLLLFLACFSKLKALQQQSNLHLIIVTWIGAHANLPLCIGRWRWNSETHSNNSFQLWGKAECFCSFLL